MAKQLPWALTLPRTDCSREGKPALLPENPRIGLATRRFHPETSSSQPRIPTPTMRWSTRSPVGTRNHWRGTRRITGAATAGPRLNVPLPPPAHTTDCSARGRTRTQLDPWQRTATRAGTRRSERRRPWDLLSVTVQRSQDVPLAKLIVRQGMRRLLVACFRQRRSRDFLRLVRPVCSRIRE